MAFTLSFSTEERNDNLLLTLTDTSGEVSTGTSTGWGSPNPVYTTIVASGGAHTLKLIVTITTSDGSETTYDKIDLYTLFAPLGGFAHVTDLVFPLDCTMLKEGTKALGDVADEFPDGIYKFEYIYDDGKVTETSTTVSALIDGKVQNSVYELLRKVPTAYDCGTCSEKDTLDPMFFKTYLDAMRASAVVSRADSIISQLYILERLVTNGSKYSW